MYHICFKNPTLTGPWASRTISIKPIKPFLYVCCINASPISYWNRTFPILAGTETCFSDMHLLTRYRKEPTIAVHMLFPIWPAHADRPLFRGTARHVVRTPSWHTASSPCKSASSCGTSQRPALPHHEMPLLWMSAYMVCDSPPTPSWGLLMTGNFFADWLRLYVRSSPKISW